MVVCWRLICAHAVQLSIITLPYTAPVELLVLSHASCTRSSVLVPLAGHRTANLFTPAYEYIAISRPTRRRGKAQPNGRALRYVRGSSYTKTKIY